MKQKIQSEIYLGHEVEVTAREVRQGVWSWTYLIDDRFVGVGRAGSESPDADAALRRGMLAARVRADGFGAK